MRKDCGTCHFEKNLLEEEPCNRCDDNNSEWKPGKIYFAIEELEKIKAEIRNLFEVEVEETGFVYERVNVYCDDVIEILDKRISELKGENK